MKTSVYFHSKTQFFMKSVPLAMRRSSIESCWRAFLFSPWKITSLPAQSTTSQCLPYRSKIFFLQQNHLLHAIQSGIQRSLQNIWSKGLNQKHREGTVVAKPKTTKKKRKRMSKKIEHPLRAHMVTKSEPELQYKCWEDNHLSICS